MLSIDGMGFWGTLGAQNNCNIEWMGWPANPLIVLLAAGWAANSKGGGHWSYIPRVDEFGTFPAGLLLMFDSNPCCIAAAQLRGQVSARHTKNCVSLPWLEISGPFAGRNLPSVSPRLTCAADDGRLRGAKELQMSDAQTHDMVL
ncbi:uncharacterized protein Triagg1_6584 [Trichoderma aggressivum f. europaeum]|uniref:Uncharacterized protein n=1 Tax=Trichoderma aggressivum f. europaeum TaxID=173218 RepID=A0AAE1LXL5_9HYPO|nr:hypothetical protein Triagg1_6584 [Trichoderma aggressivum f. europaeum]